MKFIISLPAWALLFFSACNNNPSLAGYDAAIQEVKARFAPDTRGAYFSLAAEQQGTEVAIKGMTIEAQAKKELLQLLENQGLRALDSIEVLPSPELEGRLFGVVNVSVCNIRSQPRHSAELSTQALLGTPLKVWKKEGGFYLVQTPDSYFGWLDSGGFVPLDSTGYQQYLQSARAIINRDYAFAYEQPAAGAPPVSDLLAGNILQVEGVQGSFTKVKFPDGRRGFVENENLQSLPAWLASRQPDAAHIIATAKALMGRPYLWGGTSGKGIDCSGFTKTVFFLNGLQLPRDASQQVLVGEPVETDTSLKNLLPGDLLFFGRKAENSQRERITHVAIYLGDGKIIHAANKVETGSLRREDPDFLEARLQTFVRARRMLGVQGNTGVVPLAALPYFKQGQP